MPNGGPHDPVRIRDHRRFLAIVAVLLGLVVASVLWLSVSTGTLGRPSSWIRLAAPFALMLVVLRARFRTWPPETGRLDELASWFGLAPTGHRVSGCFGDRLQEWASPKLALRVVREEGRWAVEVSDREGRPAVWYPSSLLHDLIEGGEDRWSPLDVQVAFVERAWKEIAARFAAHRREETHARLAALRTVQWPRRSPGLLP